MKRVSLFLGAAVLAAGTNAAAALEFNRCQMRVVVAGQGVAPLELPRSRFVAWMRADTARNARVGIANHTRYCVLMMIFGNYRSVPKYCREKPAALKDKTKIAAGLSGFQFTQGRDALKDAICAKPDLGRIAKAPSKGAAMDKRVLTAAKVYANQAGGPGKCPDNTVVQMKTLTLYCKAPREAGKKDTRGRDGWVLYRYTDKN